MKYDSQLDLDANLSGLIAESPAVQSQDINFYLKSLLSPGLGALALKPDHSNLELLKTIFHVLILCQILTLQEAWLILLWMISLFLVMNLKMHITSHLII